MIVHTRTEKKLSELLVPMDRRKCSFSEVRVNRICLTSQMPAWPTIWPANVCAAELFVLFVFEVWLYLIKSVPALIIGAIAKVRRSPAKRTKLVSLETPPYPRNEQKFALQASTLRPMCMQNTIWSLSLKCDLKPPPSQTNFVRFTGLLRIFAMVPKRQDLTLLQITTLTHFSRF